MYDIYVRIDRYDVIRTHTILFILFALYGTNEAGNPPIPRMHVRQSVTVLHPLLNKLTNYYT